MYGKRPYLDDLISSYFDLGVSALARREYAIAQKMFKAIFDEPGSKAEKEKIMFSLLLRSAEAHEGLKQLYKAKLLYIRALALIKKSSGSCQVQAVEILLSIARLTAEQGLYKQSLDFCFEAYDSYKRASEADPVQFIRGVRRVEQILSQKGRKAEQDRLQAILEEVREKALSAIDLDGFRSSAGLPFAAGAV